MPDLLTTNGRTQFTIGDAWAIFNVLDLNRGNAHVSKKQSITVVTDCIQFEIFADSRSVTFIT